MVPATKNTLDPNIKASRQGIDLVIYLSSLVSDVRAVDTMLDPVRVITARLGPNEIMSATDQQTVSQIAERLKQYLLTQEKLRAFTPELLEKHINDFEHGAQRQSVQNVLIVSSVIALVLVALAIFMPAPISSNTRGLIASSVFFMMVHLAAAWFFLGALHTFVQKLRQAYSLIAWGVIILGLGQIVQPVVNLLHLESTPFNTLFSVLPLIPSYLLMYLGARKFAKIIEQPLSKVTSLIAGSVGIMAVGISIILPHAPSPAPNYLMDLILSLQAINITFVVLFSAITRRVARAITSLYARPVRLLFIFTIISFFIGTYMYIVNLLTGGVPSQALLVPLIIGITINGFILLRAGYEFSRASSK